MQDPELLQDGLALMALGMGFVFVFLTVLVISVTLMSTLIRRFQPVSVAPSSVKTTSPATAADDQDNETIAVISAAVHRYRMRQRR